MFSHIQKEKLMFNGKSLLTGEPLSEKDLVIKRKFEGYEKSFDLYRCPKTGIVQTIPMPDMEELAKKEYNNSYMAYQKIDGKKTQITSSRRLRRIESNLDNKSGKRILDIGCSTGWFLKAAKERGYAVSGVEFSSYAANKANELLGDNNVIAGTLSDANFQPESFDIVHSNQVIEHVPDPVSFVQTQKKLLKKFGILVIGTPNMDSLSWKKLGGNWTSLQKPDHIVMFSPSSLTYLLERESFEVLNIHFTGMPALRGNRKTYIDTNINRANSSSKNKKNKLGKFKHWILTQPAISNLAAALIDSLKLGDTMYVIARKKS